MPSQTPAFSLRIPATLGARLRELAARDRRSLNSTILWLLEKALDMAPTQPATWIANANGKGEEGRR